MLGIGLHSDCELLFVESSAPIVCVDGAARDAPQCNITYCTDDYYNAVFSRNSRRMFSSSTFTMIL